MSLTRDQILGADDIRIVKVEVPEWGGDVYVKTLTGAQRDQWEKANAGRTVDGIISRMVAMSACDEAGTTIFTTEDADALNERSSAALLRVFRVASSLAGITNEDVEELAGNSEGGLSAASGSDSPA